MEAQYQCEKLRMQICELKQTIDIYKSQQSLPEEFVEMIMKYQDKLGKGQQQPALAAIDQRELNLPRKRSQGPKGSQKRNTSQTQK